MARMNEQITAATTDARFLASDQEMLRAEAVYASYEQELLRRIANIEADYPGYHKYHYDIEPVGHDPYVLIAILSAVKPSFHVDDPEIQNIFDQMRRPRRQYTLTVNKQLADEYASQYSDIELDAIEPKYVDIYVRLTNYDLFCTVDSLLNRQQLAAYAGYLRSHGCRPDLFSIDQYPHVTPLLRPWIHDIPAETLADYPVLNQMLSIAKPFIGYPYVWSGHEPDTSFDCSGFVDYIMEQMGLKFRNNIRGREVHLPVAGSTVNGVYYDGIYDKCARVDIGQQQPGDLAFFTGSFDASYRPSNLSHVGIYIDDQVYLACGEPYGVRYYRFNDQHPGTDMTWRQSLVCYGRLPLKNDRGDN